MAQDFTVAAKDWLQNFTANINEDDVWIGGSFNNIFIVGLDVVDVEPGRLLCNFRVPVHLTDDEGTWQVGAIATLIDVVGAAAIMTTQGVVKVSVDFNITYFNIPKFNEEVEIEAKILENRGKLSCIVLEIRNKRNRELVAIGRQWMTSGRPIGYSIQSKL